MTIVDRAASLRVRTVTTVLTVLALLVASLVFSPRAEAITWGPKLCDGFAACAKAGLGSAGYDKVYKQSFWNMIAGHNCTNYVAYRMQKAGVTRFVRYGNAYQWGAEAKRAGLTVEKGTPRVGDVAWWDRNAIGGSGLGHVAYVESVDVKAGTFTVSEDNYSADFDWRRYRISEVSGFIRVGKAAPVQKITGAVPTISGSATVDGTLTAVPGAWGPSGVTLAYQWLRNGYAIAGATRSTYRVTAADASTKLSVRVTGSKSGLTALARTSAAVTVAVPKVTGAVPLVAGTLRAGSTLALNPGTWGPSGVKITYQWLRNGRPIPGAVSRTYRLVTADIAKVVTVRVTGVKSGLATLARTSAAGGVVTR
ncbi:CHAP domain-containing protein [Microbacterium sp.]|uniref:CHAP domain-containing protein n=1 Tax=Microbacterium sp. TaxID=51671 RepID=UPI00281284D7|nr:CHAP domain-containing protein [Microbacterium sp.]